MSAHGCLTERLVELQQSMLNDSRLFAIADGNYSRSDIATAYAARVQYVMDAIKSDGQSSAASVEGREQTLKASFEAALFHAVPALDAARRTISVGHPVRDHIEAAMQELQWLKEHQPALQEAGAAPASADTRHRCWEHTPASTPRRCIREAGHLGEHIDLERRSWTTAYAPPASPQGEGYPHRCSGCGLRWMAISRGSVAAELCGDCWRKVQPILLGLPQGETKP